MNIEVKFLKMLEELLSYDTDMYLDMIANNKNGLYISLWNEEWRIQGDCFQMTIPYKSIEEANSTSFIKNTFIITKYKYFIDRIEHRFKNVDDNINSYTTTLKGLEKIISDDPDYLYILNGVKQKLQRNLKEKEELKTKMTEYCGILLKAEKELLND